MKYRSDFVTNSSSSSFILGFSDSHSMMQELKDGWNEGLVKLGVRENRRHHYSDTDKQPTSEELFERVQKDVSCAELLNRDEFLSRMSQYYAEGYSPEKGKERYEKLMKETEGKEAYVCLWYCTDGTIPEYILADYVVEFLPYTVFVDKTH